MLAGNRHVIGSCPVVERDSSEAIEMSYEYQTTAGVLRLLNIGHHWAVEFNDVFCGHWRSPDEAASAAARHDSGVPEWDRVRLAVPYDLRQWTSTGA
jgi:hypothetical protein